MKFYKSLSAVLCLLAGGAGAQNLSIEDIADVRLISGWQTEAGDFIGALKITLAPGWKTYWRVSDGLGIPPRFDWQGSDNLASVKYLWPRPHLVTTFGVLTVGYSDQLVLPIRFRPEVAGAEILATASLDIGVCKDVCIPVNTSITNVFGPGDEENGVLIRTALSDRPISAAAGGVTEVTCRLEPSKDGYSLNASFTLSPAAEAAEFVVFETPSDTIWVAPATTQREGNQLRAETSLMSFEGEDFTVDPADFRITLIGYDSSVEILGCPVEAG